MSCQLAHEFARRAHPSSAQHTQVLKKGKLRWKRIARELGKLRKECKKRYKEVTGKTAPEEEEE